MTLSLDAALELCMDIRDRDVGSMALSGSHMRDRDFSLDWSLVHLST